MGGGKVNGQFPHPAPGGWGGGLSLIGAGITTRQAGGYLDLEGGNRICIEHPRPGSILVSAAASVYISREHGRLRTTRHFV